MKRKSKLCSTGHDSGGVTMMIPLGIRRMRDRAQADAKRLARRGHLIPEEKREELAEATRNWAEKLGLPR